MQFDFIVAVDSANGIARQGAIPWNSKEDMKWFREKTMGLNSAVIMGRRTWDSLPFKPLRGRVNIVLSSQTPPSESTALWLPSFEKALEWCACDGVENVMVIGGLQIYRKALQSPYLRYGWVTRFEDNFDCDLFFTELNALPVAETRAGKGRLRFEKLDFTNREEMAYLDLLRRLLDAPTKPNRTGIPTRSLFHEVLKFKLYDPHRGPIMPLLTTKRVPWKSVAHECLWFLSGKCTDTSYLKRHGIPIWDGNSTRKFLDARGLTHYKEGELGPQYGYQFRHWNAPYPLEWGKHGIDQYAKVIDTLRRDPWCRRMIVSAWNPEQLNQMALEPCHWSHQFVVDPNEHGEPTYLNCLVNMRSADVALGVPFNIASYALITHLVAQQTGLTPGTLSLSMADTHIYKTHVEGIKIQLERAPIRFPTIHVTNQWTIDDYSFEDLRVVNYYPAKFIKLSMAV
jgi:thymidylate synthase